MLSSAHPPVFEKTRQGGQGINFRNSNAAEKPAPEKPITESPLSPVKVFAHSPRDLELAPRTRYIADRIPDADVL